MRCLNIRKWGGQIQNTDTLTLSLIIPPTLPFNVSFTSNWKLIVYLDSRFLTHALFNLPIAPTAESLNIQDACFFTPTCLCNMWKP